MRHVREAASRTARMRYRRSPAGHRPWLAQSRMLSRPKGVRRVRDRKRRPRAAALGWATAAAAAGSVALSAQAHAALPAPGSVRAGHNVSVFHEIDFVATFGHQVGTPLRIEVFRGPHFIARSAGNAVSTPEGGGLEVNHGVDFAPGPGDCWAHATADMKPYDKIVVT